MSHFRIALRHCLAQPGFSAIILVTIASTIGAAAAVFSLFDAALLRPFPYHQAERLVRLQSTDASDKASSADVSLYNFEDFRSRNRTLQGLAAYTSFTNQLTGMGQARSIRMTFASAGLFEILQVNPLLGRGFTPTEDLFGGPVLKAVLSHGLWQELFGGRPNALGQTVLLRGQGYEVIGVMPPGFSYPDRTQVWVPLMARYSSYGSDWWKRRGVRQHKVIGRLRDGVTVEQASSDASIIGDSLRKEHPEQNRNTGAKVISLRDAEVGEVKPYVHLASGAALLLLLLGCVNVANLMVARSVSREREVVIRLALGSGSWPLIWQLLAEALLLSCTGAMLGLGLTYFGVQFFLLLLPADVPEWMRLTLDFRVVLFVTFAAVGTAVLAMVLPAAQQLRANLNDVLKQGSRGSSQGHTFAAWARKILVVAEVALSLILLIGAGLMIRSFQQAMDTDSGLKTGQLLIVETGKFVANVKKESAVRAYCDDYRRIQLALSALPGVSSASAGSLIPFLGFSENRPASELFTLRRATRDQAFRIPFHGSDVMPAFFQTLGIPLLEGRDFTENDTLDRPPVVVISKRTAETLYPGENAVGQKLRFGIDEDFDPWSTVVGVVGNIRFNAAERVPGYEVYWPYRQFPGPGFRFAVRTQTEPTAMFDQIRKVIQQTNEDVSVDRITTMDGLVTESVWRRRLWGAMLAVFGGMALLLSLVGIYGVMSYLVAQQRKEIGIRMAIGAGSARILGSVIGRGMFLAGLGLAAGLLVAYPASSLLGDLLFGISGHDTVTFIAVSAAMALTAFAACVVPAIRATRVDPVIALREE